MCTHTWHIYLHTLVVSAYDWDDGIMGPPSERLANHRNPNAVEWRILFKALSNKYNLWQMEWFSLWRKWCLRCITGTENFPGSSAPAHRQEVLCGSSSCSCLPGSPAEALAPPAPGEATCEAAVSAHIFPACVPPTFPLPWLKGLHQKCRCVRVSLF